MSLNKIESIRIAGQINRQAIDFGFSIAKPGVSLIEIDQRIGNFIRDNNGLPAFFGYKGFPANSCLSVNNQIVHSIPTNYILKKLDILSIDVGTRFNNWCADAAETRIILDDDTTIPTHLEKLINGSKEITMAGINIIRPSITCWDVASAIETKAISLGLHIIPEFGGHFIGKEIHEQPILCHSTHPRYISYDMRRRMENIIFKENDVICIEPIVITGSVETIVEKDGWTVRSKDESLSAHHENTVLVTQKGYELLS